MTRAPKLLLFVGVLMFAKTLTYASINSAEIK